MAQQITDVVNEAAGRLLAAMNGCSREMAPALVERLRGEHRTIQGYAIRCMVEVLRAIGSDPEWGTDLRNQGAVEWCRALAGTEDEVLRDGISVW